MRKKIYIAILALLVFLFAYTGISKLLAMHQFESDLRNQVFPRAWVPVLLYAVPFTELTTAMLLTIRKTRLAGLLMSLWLMLCFTAYTLLVLTGMFNRLPCSCGGVIRWLTWPQHALFNISFTILILIELKIFTRESGEAENLQNRVGRFP